MIDLNHITVTFDEKRVIEDVSLSIPDGISMVIVGASGCGKTVLLRTIIGLITPDDGQVLIDGEDITRMDRKSLFRVRRKFGMLFQGAALFDSMTVEENVSLPLQEHTDLADEKIRQIVQDKLHLVGLKDTEDKKPAELSGGMKKRVGLARALVMDPKYILFDEPTTGLDPITAKKIDDLISEMHRRLHITSILVTHDMASAFLVGDRIAMLSDGSIIFDGSPGEFQHSPLEAVRLFNDARRPCEVD